MKEIMDAYIIRFRNRKLLAIVLALLSVFPLSAQQNAVGQETTERDTLFYLWHDATIDEYPNMTPEDSYMELYIENGILKKGFYWGTTDEFDRGREGYECGFFVLPMTEIRHEKDSILFKLSPIRTDKGETENCFVKTPVGRHIRSWQEAMSRYQTWDNITGGLFEKDFLFSISFGQKQKYTTPYRFPTVDSISVRNLTNDSRQKRTFFFLTSSLKKYLFYN